MVPQNLLLLGKFCGLFYKGEDMKLILIAGASGSGKTCLGEKIVKYAKENGLRALQTEYSKYIKMYAREILGYDGTRENKPRTFLQNTGDFIRKELKDETFFIRRMLEDFRIYEIYFDIVVISDVRLLLEIERMLESVYDVTTVFVKNEESQKGLTEEEKKHVTENEFRKFIDYDYIVKNEKEGVLDNAAKTILEEIK